MGSTSLHEPGRSSTPSGAGAIRASVHQTWGTGLTREVESVLKQAPLRRFTLRDLLNCVRSDATPAEVTSILAKLTARSQVLKGRVHDGRRMVCHFKWRLPGEAA